MTVERFQQGLLDWFDRAGRKHLPWQQQPTPYRVWISEIMLQQTQVTTVIPYFQRFMADFPDLEQLAAADTSAVLQRWAGLGYYARGRNLHRAAQLTLERHGGELPPRLADLIELPGIGRSTAGAILSMGFGIRAPILDGNVKRVLARYGGIEGWPGQGAVLNRLWGLADALTPDHRVGAYAQAIMDLGATLCTARKPDCPACPIRQDCHAYRTDSTARLPTPRPPKSVPVKTCYLLALRDRSGFVYLQRRPPTGIWGGLWSLPEFADRDQLELWCRSRGSAPTNLETLPPGRHTFSHFILEYIPITGQITTVPRVEEGSDTDWRDPDTDTALPTPIRRLLQRINSNPQEYP
ncbi:MAG: A/G-specific adenine glycosylase [Methylococcaceae bacterium]|nr:A/G-specific adenine glycosylase [Methylococcaceae bacterium]